MQFKQLHQDAKIPTKNNGDIGWDLYSVEGFVLEPLFDWRLFYNIVSNLQEQIRYKTKAAHNELSGLLQVLQEKRGQSFYSCKTGIAPQFSDGVSGFIWDRSGLAKKHNITILGGVVDNGFCGEIEVLMMNLGPMNYEVKVGDKIAQMVLHKEVDSDINWTEVLRSTERGDKGFGSSGR